jgi:hypothetical protein
MKGGARDHASRCRQGSNSGRAAPISFLHQIRALLIVAKELFAKEKKIMLSLRSLGPKEKAATFACNS